MPDARWLNLQVMMTVQGDTKTVADILMAIGNRIHHHVFSLDQWHTVFDENNRDVGRFKICESLR